MKKLIKSKRVAATARDTTKSKSNLADTPVAPAAAPAEVTEDSKEQPMREKLQQMKALAHKYLKFGTPMTPPELMQQARKLCDESEKLGVRVVLPPIITHETSEKQLGSPVNDIHTAVEQGDLNTVTSLLEHTPEVVFRKDNENRTPLHYAAYQGHTELVKLLLAKGAEVNAKDNAGRTPLHSAAGRGHTGSVELLLANGAEVNAKASGDLTTLHYAAAFGRVDAVKVLLANGADVNAKDEHGWTPRNLAKGEGHKKVVALLSS
jgi:hypothetical protein